jgi:superfamily II DNA helicase RecQ
VINRPKTTTDLENIKGLGTKKIEKYGEDILKLVKES